MSTLKSLSLAAALLALSGCVITSDQSADAYYDDDFSLDKAKTETEFSNENMAEVHNAANYAPNTKIVSEISKKVAAIETKLRQIQKNIKKSMENFRDLKMKNAEESNRYFEYVAHIRARLQNGTTPGNPELSEMWKQASALLAVSDKNMSDTAKLSSETVRTKSDLDSLLETIRETLMLPGAMEIDHENLRALEDEANQTIISLNRLSTDLSVQITRQQQFFSSESQNINLLSTDIQNGGLTSGARPQTTAASPASSVLPQTLPSYLSAAPELPEADLSGRRPLMIIRFDKRKVEYEQSLYKAVKAALEKRPNTLFEIVAVSPANTRSGEAEAAKNADAVRSSLLSMGLPESRIYSSKTGNATIKTTEVHLYLK